MSEERGDYKTNIGRVLQSRNLPAAADPEPMTISEALASLDKAIVVLTENISEMEARLEPVLHPVSPQDAKSYGQLASPPQSPILQEIGNLEISVNNLVQHLYEIKNRIQV